MIFLYHQHLSSLVLIETLWNVNLIAPLAGSPKSRINRNIVECK